MNSFHSTNIYSAPMSCKALGQGRGIQKRTGQNPCPITRRTNGEGKTYKERQSQCQGLGWYRARGRRPDSEGGARDRPRGAGQQDCVRRAWGEQEGTFLIRVPRTSSWPEQKGTSRKVAGEETGEGAGAGQDALHPQSEEPEARPAGHRELAGRGWAAGKHGW